jgi:hypothetical protein
MLYDFIYKNHKNPLLLLAKQMQHDLTIIYLKSSSERAPGDLVDLGGPTRPPAGEEGRAVGEEGGRGAARSERSEFSTSRPLNKSYFSNNINLIIFLLRNSDMEETSI